MINYTIYRSINTFSNGTINGFILFLCLIYSNIYNYMKDFVNSFKFYEDKSTISCMNLNMHESTKTLLNVLQLNIFTK